MTYKSGMKIKVKAEPIMLNPEEWFNDMIEDGESIEDAINAIVSYSIAESKADDLLADNDDLFTEDMEQLDNNMVEFTVKSWDD